MLLLGSEPVETAFVAVGDHAADQPGDQPAERGTEPAQARTHRCRRHDASVSALRAGDQGDRVSDEPPESCDDVPAHGFGSARRSGGQGEVDHLGVVR